MSEADEMFEELGYEEIKYIDSQTRYQKIEEGCKKKIGVIVFYHTLKDVGGYIVDSDIGEFASFTMEELKAIYKKCEELGWL